MAGFTTSIPLRIVPDTPALDREAEMPPDGRAVRFGMHGALCDHYRYQPPEEQPSTLDHLTASIGGCLIGTFAGSLRRARVRVRPEDLTAVARGEVEAEDDGVLVLRRVVLHYRLVLDGAQREMAEEVHTAHAARCPNARSVAGAIRIDSELEIVEPVTA